MTPTPALAKPRTQATALADLIRALDAATPQTTSPAQARALCAQAKRLHRTDLLPQWLRLQPQRCAAPTTATTTPAPHDPEPILEAKAALSGLPVAVLRQVYCREMSSPQPTPMPRSDVAHARVNSFIRLAQGDSSARCDDADLLSLLN